MYTPFLFLKLYLTYLLAEWDENFRFGMHHTKPMTSFLNNIKVDDKVVLFIIFF